MRIITPHKGGRSIKLSARATPDIKRKIDRIQLRDGESLGDLIQRWVDAEYAEVEPDPAPTIMTEAGEREEAKGRVIVEVSEELTDDD